MKLRKNNPSFGIFLINSILSTIILMAWVHLSIAGFPTYHSFQSKSTFVTSKLRLAVLLYFLENYFDSGIPLTFLSASSPFLLSLNPMDAVHFSLVCGSTIGTLSICPFSSNAFIISSSISCP